MTHEDLVHKFIPMPQAMKIPDAKAAVDKEWKKLETIPAWNQTTEKTQKFAKMQEENWKDFWLPRCRVKDIPSVVKTSANPKIGNENELKSMYDCFVESHEFSRPRAESLQSKNREDHIDTSQPSAQVYSDATSDENSGCKGCRGQGMEEAGDDPSIKNWTRVKSKKGLFWKHKETKRKSTFATLLDICHLKNTELATKNTEIRRQSRARERHRKRRLWSPCSFY